MSTKSELRLTDTNAASDSKGKTWGLEGGLFWWLISGVGSSITLFFVPLTRRPQRIAPDLAFLRGAHSPVSLCLAYIFGKPQGKPPGYDRDIIENT